VTHVPEQPSAVLRYGNAVVLALIAVAITALAEPWLGVNVLPPFLVAVAASAWFGGLGPGLVATAVAIAAVDIMLFGAPEQWFTAESLPRLLVFLVAAVVISHLTASQRKSALAIRSGEESLRAMLDTANEGVWLLDRSGRVIFANGRMATLLGLQPAEMIGRSATSFLAQGDTLHPKAWLERAVAGESVTFEGHLQREDGDAVVVAGGASPVRNASGEVVALLGMFSDMTERDRAERELARANERYTLAADAMQELIYDWDLAAGLVERSPGLLHVTGYRPEEAEGISGWWRARIHPDDLPSFDRTIPSLPPIEDRFDVTYRVRHRDGRYRVVHDIGRVVRDEVDHPVRAVGSVVDVSEKTSAEASLRLLARAAERLSAETDYQRTLEAVASLGIPDLGDWCAVDLLDDEGEVRRVAVFPDIGEVDPSTAWKPSPAWVRSGARVLAPELASLAGVIGAEELAALEAAGAVSLLSAPLEVRGERMGALTFLSLQPEHRFHEEDLELGAHLARRSALAIENARLFSEAKAAQARFRGIFEGTTDGLLVIDARGAIVDVNPAVSALLQAEPGALLGRGLADLSSAWSPADMAELRAIGTWRGELDLLVDGGEPAPVDASIAQVELAGDEVYVAVLRDVRERREYEKMQEEFLSSVAHDLKNPLAAVRGQAQLLRRRLLRGDMPDPERLMTGLTAIDDGAGRMAGMIDELVDVARLRAGQPIELRRQPTDLVTIARRNVEEMQRIDDRHQFTLEADEPSVIGMWDHARIERVVANLVGNAVKFSPRGGPVTVRVSRDDALGVSSAVLSVSDRGVGIPSADLPYVFERFHRGRNVGGIRGSGIGLAGARSIVEGHGGTVSVESVEGRGSTFTVRLPVDAS
jgi:PAS domain S-box-containing protein